jgi:hypothetical protein
MGDETRKALPAAIGWLRTTSHTLAQRVSSSMHDRCEDFEYDKVLNGELEVGGWFVSCISILRKDGDLSTIPSSTSASQTPPSTLDTNSLSCTEYSKFPIPYSHSALSTVYAHTQSHRRHHRPFLLKPQSLVPVKLPDRPTTRPPHTRSSPYLPADRTRCSRRLKRTGSHV